MPLLNRATAGEHRRPRGGPDGPGRHMEIPFAGRERPRGGLLESCSNVGCGSGWLHLLRSRSAPVFEGGWTCSAECTGERIGAAVRRELDGRGSGTAAYRHRMPLGLLMMEQGWITPQQLKQALEAQKEAGCGRLGDFLVRQQAVSEQLVTRALSLQWSCPVLPLEFHDPQALAPLLPRLFVDAFGVLPLRVAAGRLAYLGFEERLDPVVALALERMSGLRVESGLIRGSEFRPAHTRMLNAAFPRVELLEAVSEPALVRALARTVERTRPVESRLIRVHDCLWLRMWIRPQAGPLPEPDSVEDVIASVGA
jgi:hypothetical protein